MESRAENEQRASSQEETRAQKGSIYTWGRHVCGMLGVADS